MLIRSYHQPESADCLSTALAEQQKRVLRTEQKRFAGLIAFYTYMTLSAATDLPDVLTHRTGLLRLAFLAAFAAGPIIILTYCCTRSRPLANWGTIFYMMTLGICRIFAGKSGLLGIAEIILSVTWVFSFMDVTYAAVLNYALLIIKTIVFFQFIPISYPAIYSKDRIVWYLYGTLLTCGISHWFAYKVHQISTYRDKSLSLASQYCDELEASRDRAEELRLVAERARDEAKLAEQKAVQANLAKSRFLSNLSHDIRTPMNAILGYTTIAGQHLDDRERVADCLDKIEAAESHLSDIINDCLDLSRIENGRETLTEGVVSFRQLSEEVAAIVAPAAAQKKLVLDSDAVSLRHACVLADRAKLRRILVNILGNAVKYTGEGGRISCCLEETEEAAERSRYRFVIRDTGIGMSPEYLKHIFEPFSRENNALSSIVTGTGLGMSIAKKYVELMGGGIAVDSEQGRGTTVTVSAEFFWCSEEQTLEEEMSNDTVSGKRVLYVDDSLLNREVAATLLEDIGIEAETASNGQEAVERLNQSEDGEFDLVLMDVRMPVMDGITAARVLRGSGRERLRQIPIIAVTANAFVEDEEACLAAGMNGYLTKPFTVADFIRKLGELEEGKKRIGRCEKQY